MIDPYAREGRGSHDTGTVLCVKVLRMPEYQCSEGLGCVPGSDDSVKGDFQMHPNLCF